MSQQEHQISWTLRVGMPISGDLALDALHARVLSELPVHADAIVWLQGNRYDRGTKVLELFRDGYASKIVITGNDTQPDEACAVDGVHVTTGDLRQWLLNHAVPALAIGVDGQAMHTRDQAVHVLTFAHTQGWRTLLLIASPHHQLRAFLTFVNHAQESGWCGRIVNQPAALRWDAIPSGRLKMSAACFTEELEKIAKYHEHIASVAAGIAALDSARYHAHTGNVCIRSSSRR